MQFSVTMEKIEKKITKFIDHLEEKQIRDYEKLLKKMEKLHEENREEIRKRMNNCESMFREFRREVYKMFEYNSSTCNSETTKEQEDTWYPPEICRPISFMEEFILTDRIDFVNYYLDARFQDKFRGDRYQSCWMKNSKGKYIRTTFDKIFSYLELVEYQFKLCFANPFEYRKEKTGSYFDKFNNFLEFGDLKLTRETLRKFLIYKHKSLAPLRK